MIALRNILILSIVVISFCSCGNDDDFDGIRYRYSRYAKFEVYAGSETGGGELIRIKMDTVRYFNQVIESFTDAMISFSGDKIQIGQVSISEISPYKFEDEKLYIYNDGNWQYFGYGNTGKLAIRQNYAAYKKGNNVIHRFRGPSQDGYTLEEAIVNTPFNNLSEMAENDTLIVCTRDAYFE